MKCQLDGYSNGQANCDAQATHTVERFPKKQEAEPDEKRTVDTFKLCEEHADDVVKGGHLHVIPDEPYVVTITRGAR